MSRRFFNYLKDEYIDDFYGDVEDYTDFYEEIVASTNVTNKDAMDVIRLLEKDETEEAENLVEKLLT